MASGQGGIPRGRGGPRRQPRRPAERRQPRRPAERRQPRRLTARRYAAVFLAVATTLTVVGCGQAGQGAPVAPRTMFVSSEAFEQNILPQTYCGDRQFGGTYHVFSGYRDQTYPPRSSYCERSRRSGRAADRK